MKTQLIIRDFKRTEGLENFLKTRIEECVSQFFTRTENAQLSVKAQEERHRTENRKPSFLLEEWRCEPISWSCFEAHVSVS